MPVKGQMLDRYGDDDLFVLGVDVFDGYLRACNGHIVKAVIADVVDRPLGSIDRPAGIHECKLLGAVELFHPGLKGLKMLHVRKIGLIQQLQGVVNILNVAVYIGGYDLLPSARQFAQIEIADNVNRFFCIFPGADARQKRR